MAGETSTSLAINVRMRTSEPAFNSRSAFRQAAFNMGKTFEDVAFSSKGSLRGSLNKEAAFTLSDSEPGPHVLTLTNFHGEVLVASYLLFVLKMMGSSTSDGVFIHLLFCSLNLESFPHFRRPL